MCSGIVWEKTRPEASYSARGGTALITRRRPGFRALLGLLGLLGAAGTALVGPGVARATPGFSETLLLGNIDHVSSMAIAPDGRIFIARQGGQIRIYKNGVMLPTPFATVPTVSSNEEGLLGVTFDPAFAANGYVYAYFTAQTPNRHNVVWRFTANGDVAVPASQVELIALDDRTQTVHAGGALRFGPDGKLYIGSGDAGTGTNAQTLASTSGKLLRINADGSIPTNNPFYGSTSGVYRSIWAWGLRNPFTMDFQPGTGLLYINDVGAATWEEVNAGQAGGNYGWPFVQGIGSNPAYINPVHVYSHDEGCAITGGAFYNPTRVRYPGSYVGKYFYGDFCAGRIRWIDPAAPAAFNDFLFCAQVAPVDVELGPDGYLYYLARGGFFGGNDTTAVGSLVRISYGVGDAAQIMVPPKDQSASLNSTPTFSVTATGAPALHCQWYKNGAPIGGATNFSYTLPPVQVGDYGRPWTCVVWNSAGADTSAAVTVTNVSGVGQPDDGGAARLITLSPARPNPVAGSTRIDYRLQRAGQVTLALYDVRGRLVARLPQGFQAAGEHAVNWTPDGLPEGTYFYALTAAGETVTRKLQVVR